MRSPALIHLLILAIPPIAIAFTILSGSQPRAVSGWFVTASNACFWTGGPLILVAIGMGFVGRRKPFDERAAERQLATTMVGFDLVADSFPFLLAIASPVVALLFSACVAAWLLFWSQSRVRGTTVSSSYVVQRSPDVVFAFVSDSRNEPRYYPDVESVEMLTAAPLGPGTQFRCHVQLPGARKFVGVEEIVDYEPYHRLTTRVAATSRPNLDEYIFERVENGTRVTHRFDFELSLASAVMGGQLWQLAARRLVKTRRHAGEVRLKQILESGEFDS
ncbi:MAG TPA: SRPBCC family protein [Candidatus Nitrosotalea sp.]|nr:SRPBCC family protein [Candidatus Nitrosotalea sp.]